MKHLFCNRLKYDIGAGRSPTMLWGAWFILLWVPQVIRAQGPPEIDQVYATFSEAYRQLDPRMLYELYEDSAYYMYPQIPIRRGHQHFMPGFTDMFNRARADSNQLQIQFRIVERRLMGDYAYDVGYYKLTRTVGNTSVGKFVTILHRQTDGGWKFVLDSYSDAPREAFDR